MNATLVVLAASLWLTSLFGVALLAERRPGVLARRWDHVYALSLAVYCTSWTFYGTITQAARHGWPLPPTFIGTILLYLLAATALARLVRLAQASNATSLADLIATRLGKDPWLAATVTAVAVLGLIPYIALQLKAVATSYALLTGTDARVALPPWRDGGLIVALSMAVFAIGFGTRRASIAEHNRGLVLAMAFESLFKLAAMLALGAFVWFGLDFPAGGAPASAAAPAPTGFVPLVLLGALAMFTLPHQFHVAVVECRDAAHVRTARWLFPAYLLLIALPILPLARAGQALLSARGLDSDLYVLALPLSQGHTGLALLAFLGGLSAATGMVVVSTLTLSLMIGNHWLAPALLRGWWRRGRGDLRGHVLALRRVGIVVLMLLAWAYSRWIAGNAALADVGALSFSALATLAPALAFSVWRPRTPPLAVGAGIVTAFLAWCWTLPLPVLMATAPAPPDWFVAGPAGVRWLAPDSFLGLTGWDRLGRAVASSLGIGTLSTLALAASVRPRATLRAGRMDQRTLRGLARRFLPEQAIVRLFAPASAVETVPEEVEAAVEHELAAVLGTASARVLLDAARREEGRDLETVAAIVGETARDLRFNQRVLEAALQNMTQGISVVDGELRLVAWNRRYEELFDFPRNLLRVGTPIAELSRWALRAHGIDDGNDGVALRRRLEHMRAGTSHLSERVFPDGGIVEIRGNPMPGGGFVATFTDVTEFRRAETELKVANETLEQRVAGRTADLERAKRDAERANDAKSRFLAAIGHDLMQPLHAAQLFTDALARNPHADAAATSIRHLRGALDSTHDLLTGLLDMSRLEAGGLVPETRAFALADVLEPLAAEFRALAADRGLRFGFVPSSAWVRSDPALLRRIVQNFLANAVRYTQTGGLVLGVRHVGGSVRIDVCDSGPGIPAHVQAVMFEEFRRGQDAGGQGLGLGLWIAQRIAGLLRAPLQAHSVEGAGSRFSVLLPRARRAAGVDIAPRRKSVDGLRVLVVDNDPGAATALSQLLSGWGCEVDVAGDETEARRRLQEARADLWLFDYHLDAGDNGVSLHERLRTDHGDPPCLILSADQTGAVRQAAQEAGLALVMKPVRPLALKSVLDRLLAARAALSAA